MCLCTMDVWMEVTNSCLSLTRYSRTMATRRGHRWYIPIVRLLRCRSCQRLRKMNLPGPKISMRSPAASACSARWSVSTFAPKPYAWSISQSISSLWLPLQHASLTRHGFSLGSTTPISEQFLMTRYVSMLSAYFSMIDPHSPKLRFNPSHTLWSPIPLGPQTFPDRWSWFAALDSFDGAWVSGVKCISSSREEIERPNWGPSWAYCVGTFSSVEFLCEQCHLMCVTLEMFFSLE